MFELPKNGTIPRLGETIAGYNPRTGEGSIAVEFAGTAVSSPSSYGQTLNASQYKAVSEVYVNDPTNPGLQFAEGQMRGYFRLSMTQSALRADYIGWTMAQQQLPPTNGTLLASFTVLKDTNRVQRPLNGGNVPQFGAIKGYGAAAANSVTASASASASASA